MERRRAGVISRGRDARSGRIFTDKFGDIMSLPRGTAREIIESSGARGMAHENQKEPHEGRPRLDLVMPNDKTGTALLRLPAQALPAQALPA